MEDKEQVIETINRAWGKDLIIRALYVRMAPFFERDLNFFFASSETQLEYIKNIPNPIGRKVICLSLCQYFQEILEMFDINCKIITTNQKIVPHFALIVEGDIGWYYIDPLKDLMNNQAGLRTTYYGILFSRKQSSGLQNYHFLKELPLEYINEMDKFLGLYPNGILDDYLEKVHLELTTNKAYIYLGNYLNQNLEKFDRRMLYKMKMIFLNERLINKTNIPGTIERAQYYNRLLGSILNHSERSRAISRCRKDLPIIVKINDSVYIDGECGERRELILDDNPSCEVMCLLRESPKFRL